MAAIDKIYINKFEDYKLFKDWCSKQPKIKDKYGKEVSLSDFIYKWDEWVDDKPHPVCSMPYYIDAYLIRNCPYDFIQEELAFSYGKWPQDMIDDAYNVVMRRGGEKTVSGIYHWLSKDDFVVVDGQITLNQETGYDQIKANKLYTTPSTNQIYEIGSTFKIIQHPNPRYNRPYKYRCWHIHVEAPQELDSYMWYHDNINTWDFPEEFISGGGVSSHCIKYKTIKAIKRAILKWKLPVGTIVTCESMCMDDTYKFKICK